MLNARQQGLLGMTNFGCEEVVLPQPVAPPPPVRSFAEQARTELDRFKLEDELPIFTMVSGQPHYQDPLQWWRMRRELYPTLYALALKYLCVPATSAPAERLFSHAGLTATKLRAALRPDNLEALVFAHDISPTVDDYKKRNGAGEAAYGAGIR